MISKVIIIFSLLLSCLIQAQQEQVVIHELKKGKRIVLQAENKTKDSLNIFLMLHAQGFRRSADKPILKTLAPFSKTNMTTLIALDIAAASYTYDLIVNETLDNTIALEHKKEVIDIEKVLEGKRVIFRMTDCEKCDALQPLLKAQRISHRVVNIDQDPATYAQFMAFIDKELTTETEIRFPVIWNKSYAIFGYEDLGKVIKEVK